VHGFRGATIDKIAVRESMSKPNLLYYLTRKDNACAPLLKHTLTDWLESLKQLHAKGDLAEEIWSYIKRKLKLLRSHHLLPSYSPMKFCKARHGSNQSWKTS
jgi:TetR/AcrR family transcriptional regulator